MLMVTHANKKCVPLRKEKDMTREKVKVKDNGYGGAVHIVQDDIGVYGIVQVEQRELSVENKRMKWGIRKGEIKGELDDLFYMNYQSGEVLDGNVVIKESLDPIIADDPEHGLYWRDNKVVRCEGKPVYRTSYYTEDINDTDRLYTTADQQK